MSCAAVAHDQYGRTVAACAVDGIDLGDWLVGHGLALDWPHYSHGRYGAAQHAAQGAQRGIWSGSFVQPWDYRACVRNGGRPGDCSDDENAYP